MVIDYSDEVEGIEKDIEFKEDYSEISEEIDDEEVEMDFPDNDWGYAG